MNRTSNIDTKKSLNANFIEHVSAEKHFARSPHSTRIPPRLLPYYADNTMPKSDALFAFMKQAVESEAGPGLAKKVNARIIYHITPVGTNKISTRPA